MRTSLRRTGPTTIELSVMMPIDAWSRSTADREVELLRHSIIPIIGADARRRPYLVGSALVLTYRGRKVLVTAEHVLGGNEIASLAFFGADGCSRPFAGDFVISSAYDLAVKLLRPDEVDSLSHIPTIEEAVLGRAAPVGDRFYASIAGYPATAAKRKNKVTLDTPMDAYSNVSTEHLDGSLSVYFDKKEGAANEAGHVTPCDPFGKSGGAIFGFSLDGWHLRPKQKAKLVGVPTRWKREEKRIQGTSIAVVIRLLDELIVGAVRSPA